MADVKARIDAKRTEIAAAVANFDWDHLELTAELEALEAEQAAECLAEQRAAKIKATDERNERDKQDARDWVEEYPAARNALADKVQAYLRSTNGKLGEYAEGIAAAIPHDHRYDTDPRQMAGLAISNRDRSREAHQSARG